MTAKQILKMDYGSSEQIDTADRWWKRFIRFNRSHPDFYTGVNESFLIDVKRKLLNTDVFYQCNRRGL